MLPNISLGKLLAVGVGSFLLVVIALIATVSYPPQRDKRQVEVRGIEWWPGQEVLKIRVESGLTTTLEDLENLRELGLKGEISLAGSGVFGTGDRVKVTIVMHRPAQESVRLAQPDKTDLYYVQQLDGSWKSYPPQAPTSSRAILLFPDPRQPKWATRYAVENVDGSRQGGTLFTWGSD